MAWGDPKTDWGVDVVGSSDFNRIEENTRVAALMLGHGYAIESIASANNLAITDTTNVFLVTGTNDIHYIRTTGRQAGAVIFLAFEYGIGTIKNNQGSAPEGYAKILTLGDISMQANAVKAFIYDGTQWRWLTDNT